MARSHDLSAAHRESGQVLVLLTVALVAMLGMAGLAIDYGNMVVNRRQLQNAADAAALAAAAKIPAGYSAEQSAALGEYAKNGLSTDSVTVTQTTNQTNDDSVTVSDSRGVGTWFLKSLGISTVQVSATAQGTIQSFTGLNGPNVMPWGVLQGTYVPGQQYSIYTKAVSNANNGALSLPYISGANCPIPNGANAYSNEIDGTLQPCPITLGESVDTKTGDNSGPTSQGLNSRITTWQTLNQIVQFNADGTDTVLDQNSPQLVLIPVLTNPSGQSQWPNGTSSPMTVVGFAWFVILSCGDPSHPSYCANNDGKQVNGVFVNLDTAPSTGTSGQYNPNGGTAYTESLTG